MASLYITEHNDVHRRTVGGHVLQVPNDYGYDQSPVSIGISSTQSSAFRAETSFIRINTDSACSVAFGSNPTATTNNRRMSAGQTEYFPVRGGDRLAVISNT